MTFDFESYMHQVAITHKSIAHIDDDEDNKRYYRASSTGNVEEVIQHLPKVEGVCLVIEDNFEAPLVESGSGHLKYRQLCSYFLLKKFNVNDMVDRNTMKNQLIAVNEDIISKLRKDYKEDQSGITPLKGLFGLEFNSFNTFTFGPVLDNMLGLHCAFTLLFPLELVYNADNWNS